MNKNKKINTDILGLRIGNPLLVPNKSGFYHAVLKTWFDYFGIVGRGILIGDKKEVVPILKLKYPKIIEILTVDYFKDSDISWDITIPFKDNNFKVEWIICQAVLEHVKNPISSIINLSNLLDKDGLLFLHVPAFGVGYHGFPIDCYRFSINALDAFQEIADLIMIDSFFDEEKVMAVYRREKL